MNRNIKIILLVVLALCFMFFIGCEGPAGSDGIDGIAGSDGADGSDGSDGADGNVTCFQCHATDIFEQARYDFAASQHSSGSVAVAYAGGNVQYGACTECHSHEGFLAFANGFEAKSISNPSPWECGTCHTIHDEFTSEDYNLRMTTAASIWDGGTFALKGQALMELEGGDALCANCHQSRRAGPTDMGGEMVDLDGDYVPETLVPAGSFFISSEHYGPHHGPQANVLTGAGFPELAGSTAYPASGSNVHLATSCTGCHMYENDHSFEASLAACNVCHATNDFNYGGVQEEIEELLDDLAAILEANGVIAKGHDDEYVINQETGLIQLVTTVGGYHPVVGIHTLLNSQAFFIWVGLEEDRSLGVHNPKYVIALLENIIEALS